MKQGIIKKLSLILIVVVLLLVAGGLFAAWEEPIYLYDHSDSQWVVTDATIANPISPGNDTLLYIIAESRGPKSRVRAGKIYHEILLSSEVLLYDSFFVAQQMIDLPEDLSYHPDSIFVCPVWFNYLGVFGLIQYNDGVFTYNGDYYDFRVAGWGVDNFSITSSSEPDTDDLGFCIVDLGDTDAIFFFNLLNAFPISESNIVLPYYSCYHMLQVEAQRINADTSFVFLIVNSSLYYYTFFRGGPTTTLPGTMEFLVEGVGLFAEPTIDVSSRTVYYLGISGHLCAFRLATFTVDTLTSFDTLYYDDPRFVVIDTLREETKCAVFWRRSLDESLLVYIDSSGIYRTPYMGGYPLAAFWSGSDNFWFLVDRDTGSGVPWYYYLFWGHGTPDSSDLIIDTTGIAESAPAKPQAISLSAHPNPFNSAVKITLDGGRGLINQTPTVEIFDLSGRRVAELIPPGPPLTRGEAEKSPLSSGEAEKSPLTRGEAEKSPLSKGDLGGLVWTPAASLPSGVYLVRIETDRGTAERKITYLK